MTIPSPPQRIQIIGPSCAGKTTLAHTLGQRLGLPVTDLDELWWSPGWVQLGHAAMRERLQPLAESPAWVVSGNYFPSSEPVLWPRVEWLIVLDFPLGLVTWRGLKRTVRRSLTGEPCCNGNREQLHRLLHPEGVLVYTLRTWGRRHARYRTLADEPALAAARVTRLASPGDLARWLDTLAPATVAPPSPAHAADAV